MDETECWSCVTGHPTRVNVYRKIAWGSQIELHDFCSSTSVSPAPRGFHAMTVTAVFGRSTLAGECLCPWWHHPKIDNPADRLPLRPLELAACPKETILIDRQHQGSTYRASTRRRGRRLQPRPLLGCLGSSAVELTISSYVPTVPARARPWPPPMPRGGRPRAAHGR